MTLNEYVQSDYIALCRLSGAVDAIATFDDPAYALSALQQVAKVYASTLADLRAAAEGEPRAWWAKVVEEVGDET
jgi:hypothetical protein